MTRTIAQKPCSNTCNNTGNCVWIVLFICICLFCGCDKGGSINDSMAERHFIPANFHTDDGHVSAMSQKINGQETTVTRFNFTSDDISRSAGMAQHLILNRNSRLLGVRFHIRCLSDSTSLAPCLEAHNAADSFFLSNNHIELNTPGWQEVVLTFQSFTDTASRMNLDIDSFLPGEYEGATLILIPLENDGKDRVIEWGPVEAIYDDHRYRFH